MTRTYGRSRQGTRLLQKGLHGRWQTTTFLGALPVSGFIAPLTIDGPITGPLFRSWVKQHLAPVLKPGDIVVMDNLSSHKVAGVREAIEAVGAELRYLPPYSPDPAPYWTPPSNWLFQSSKNSCETEPHEPLISSGNSAEVFSTSSPKSNAETTSNTAATATPEMEPL